MKTLIHLSLLAVLFLVSCNNTEYVQVEVENPVYYPNLKFHHSEDISLPRFAHLKEKYQIDTIFHGETDEFKRVLLLRHWIKSVIAIDDHGDPYPGGGRVEGILDEALKGQGYHCGHYMRVQNAVMNAYGYVTRTLGAGPGVKGGPDGHHGINEIWLSSYQKWFLSDAKYDHHFEKDGIPLSAIEVHDEYLKNEATDIYKVKGPDRVPFDIDPETGVGTVRSAQTYTWIEWHGNNNMFSMEPDYEELLIMYEDDYFKNNTWIWNDKPHWAYDVPGMIVPVPDKNEIEWTPNTISSKVDLSGNKVMIELLSETPNFKTYQMKDINSGNWKDCEDKVEMKLEGDRVELNFRVMNIAGVVGSKHKIELKKIK